MTKQYRNREWYVASLQPERAEIEAAEAKVRRERSIRRMNEPLRVPLAHFMPASLKKE